LAYRADKGRLSIDPATKEISVGVLPFADSPSVFWTQDETGHIIREVSSGHLTVTPTDYSNEVDAGLNTPDFDLSIFRWVSSADSLYHYDATDHILKPVFTVSFNDDHILQHEYIELPGHFLIRLYAPESSASSAIMLDKKSLRGAYVKFRLKGLGGVEIPSGDLNFRHGFYWANLYPSDMQKEVERVLSGQDALDPETKERLLKLLDYADDDSNNIIFTGRLGKEEDPGNNRITLVDAVKKTTVKNKKTKDKKTDSAETQEEEADDKLYLFADVLAHKLKNTPYLDQAKKYFRENNLYKDWDPQDKKEVQIAYIVEKNGIATNVEVEKSCGIEMLDKEAVRLIKEARYTPGHNVKGK
jgi:TonB family protein